MLSIGPLRQRFCLRFSKNLSDKSRRYYEQRPMDRLQIRGKTGYNMPFLPCAPWLCCAFLLIASTALKAADPKETTSPPSTPTIHSAATATKGDPAASPWPGARVDLWHGFVRHRFAVDGATAWVVEPRQAALGKPWTWCLEFPDAFTDRTGVLRHRMMSQSRREPPCRADRCVPDHAVDPPSVDARCRALNAADLGGETSLGIAHRAEQVRTNKAQN